MATDSPEEDFANSILVCVDCGEEFVFTASAQKYFSDRGFVDPPKRCKSCYNDFRRTDEADVEEQAPDPALPPPSSDGGLPGIVKRP
jgi:hypothetical protein